MPELSLTDWLLAIVAGLGVGISKSGFAGVSLVHVDGASPEVRRVLVARLPGRAAPAVTAVTRAIMAAV